VLAKVFAILYNKGRTILEGRLMAVAARKSKAPAQPKAAAKPAKARAAKEGAGKTSALSNAPTFTKEEDLHAYREMLLIRRFEEKAGQMYGMGLIGGFCHLYIGQEAVVIGMQMASKDGDQVITG